MYHNARRLVKVNRLLSLSLKSRLMYTRDLFPAPLSFIIVLKVLSCRALGLIAFFVGIKVRVKSLKKVCWVTVGKNLTDFFQNIFIYKKIQETETSNESFLNPVCHIKLLFSYNKNINTINYIEKCIFSWKMII